MGIGKAVKNLFWQSDDDEEEPSEVAVDDGEELSDEDFAAMLAEDPMTVPADAVDPVPAESIAVSAAEDGGVSIDFQAQYDSAGIPDTDEVEQLENFLQRLDTQLPRASKVAAAQAFLGAIGKGQQDVMADAERKIMRVHGILQAHQQGTASTIASEQATIDSLQAQIDGHRERIETLNREFEGVKRACLVEESRLQAARVFFGHMEPPTA